MLAHRLSLVDIANELERHEPGHVGRTPGEGLFAISRSDHEPVRQSRRHPQYRRRDRQWRRPSASAIWPRFATASATATTLITGNGQPAALINISRQIGGNILQLTQQVKDQVDDLGSAIPKTLHISIVYDLAEFVSDSIGSVRDAISSAPCSPSLILFGFLRDGEPLSSPPLRCRSRSSGRFFFLKIFGGTLNLMSLGGLAIAIGLIIDDAVVVIENIYRHLGPGRIPANRCGTRHAGIARACDRLDGDNSGRVSASQPAAGRCRGILFARCASRSACRFCSRSYSPSP